MKICNSCMQMTGDASEKCPVCKMSDFTSLSADGAEREKEIHKLKESKGLVNKPHRNIRRVRYRLASGQRSWLRNLMTFVVGSLVLSVVTNSTIWSSPGNPLDVRSWPGYITEATDWVSSNLQTQNGSTQVITDGGEYSTNAFEYTLNRVFFTRDTDQNLGYLVVYLNGKNVTSEPQLMAWAPGSLFDLENWEYESVNDYPKEGNRARCDDWVPYNLPILPNETYQTGLCFLVDDIRDYKLVVMSEPLQIRQETVSSTFVEPNAVDLPDVASAAAGDTIEVGPFSVTLNEVFRGTQPFEYVQFDVTITNNGDEGFDSPTITTLSSLGKRYGLEDVEGVEGDRGETYSYIMPGLSHRFKTSIELANRIGLELEFTSMPHSLSPNQPVGAASFYLPPID